MDEEHQDGDPVAAQLQQHNQLIMAAIDTRIASGLRAALEPADYYVIRNRDTGVRSVLASASVHDDKAVIFGPASFATCLREVNQLVLASLAETGNLETQQDKFEEIKK